MSESLSSRHKKNTLKVYIWIWEIFVSTRFNALIWSPAVEKESWIPERNKDSWPGDWKVQIWELENPTSDLKKIAGAKWDSTFRLNNGSECDLRYNQFRYTILNDCSTGDTHQQVQDDPCILVSLMQLSLILACIKALSKISRICTGRHTFRRRAPPPWAAAEDINRTLVRTLIIGDGRFFFKNHPAKFFLRDPCRKNRYVHWTQLVHLTF